MRSVDDLIERGGLERRCSGRETQAFEDLARNCRIFDDCNESEGGSAAWTAKPIDVEHALEQSRPGLSLRSRGCCRVTRWRSHECRRLSPNTPLPSRQIAGGLALLGLLIFLARFGAIAALRQRPVATAFSIGLVVLIGASPVANAEPPPPNI